MFLNSSVTHVLDLYTAPGVAPRIHGVPLCCLTRQGGCGTRPGRAHATCPAMGLEQSSPHPLVESSCSAQFPLMGSVPSEFLRNLSLRNSCPFGFFQGFMLHSAQASQLATPFGEIPAQGLFTSRGPRKEPVTYWFTVGDKPVHGKLQKRLVDLRYGPSERIPEGMLFRSRVRYASFSQRSEKRSVPRFRLRRTIHGRPRHRLRSRDQSRMRTPRYPHFLYRP